MNEKEKKAIEDIKRTIELYELKPIDRISVEFDEFDYKIFKTILNLIKKQQNRIDELEKALIDEDLKYRNKIKQYEEQNKEYLNAIKSILLNIPNNEIEISNKDIVQAEKYYVVAKRNVMNNSQKLCLYKGGV